MSENDGSGSDNKQRGKKGKTSPLPNKKSKARLSGGKNEEEETAKKRKQESKVPVDDYPLKIDGMQINMFWDKAHDIYWMPGHETKKFYGHDVQGIRFLLFAFSIVNPSN